MFRLWAVPEVVERTLSMRILMAVHDFLPRHAAGTEIYAAGLARALQSLGHSVLIVTTEAHPGISRGKRFDRDLDGLSVVEFADGQCLEDLRGWRNPEIQDRLSELLDSFQPDILHLQHLRFLGYGLPGAARARGIRIAMTLHDFDLLCARYGRLRRRDLSLCEGPEPSTCALCCADFSPAPAAPPVPVRRWLSRLPEPIKKCLRPLKGRRRAGELLIAPEVDLSLEHELALRERLAVGKVALSACDLVVSPSRFLARVFGDAGFRGKGEILVSRNGQDATGFDAHGRRSGIEDGLRVGYFGTVSEDKGLLVLVAAARLCRDRDDISFHIHGATDMHPEFGEELRRAAAETSCEFAGAYDRADLARLMAEVDIVVVPSLWYENAPLTIAEAQMAGRPVLASDLGGMAESVRHEVDGLLFSPGDQEALAEAVCRIRDETGLWERLAAGIRAPKTFAEDAADWELRYASLIQEGKEPEVPADPPTLSVVIPTKNGGPLFAEVLDRIIAQDLDGDFEIICIDSGSTDGTVEFISQREKVVLSEIPPEKFDHGATRQAGIEMARAEYVALFSQDALCADHRVLSRMLKHFDDPNVAGVTAGQRPRDDANPFQVLRIQGPPRGREPVRRSLAGGEAAWEARSPRQRLELAAHDNVASMIRRSDALERPFETQRFGEDLRWGKEAILAGRTLITDHAAEVIHSHENGAVYEAKRVYLDHATLFELSGWRSMPNLIYCLAASLKSTLQLVSAAARDRRSWRYRLAWMARAPWYAVTQNLAQYAGSRAAAARYRGFWAGVDRRLRGGV